MNQKLKIGVGLVSLFLLATLVYKLTNVPGGMILSGLFLGGIVIALILLGALILAAIGKLAFKPFPFWTVYFTLTAIAFAVFHYLIYSPTVKIVVPENYVGKVSLIKSNVVKNELTLDSNGIGYLNSSTFEKLYSRPIVVDVNGVNLANQCVGFNPSTFFASGTSSSSRSEKEIESLSFEIVPKDKIGEKQRYRVNLAKTVDYDKIE